MAEAKAKKAADSKVAETKKAAAAEALAVFNSWPGDVEGEGWLAEEVERELDRRAECIDDGRLTSIFAAFVFTEMKDIKTPK